MVTNKRLTPILLLGLACLPAFCVSSMADEIVFKKEHGGGRVKCEIYREDDEYLRYIDIKKNEDCGCSREIVAEVIKEPGELIDVEEFFRKKAEKAQDEAGRERALATAEELRRKREAEAAAAAAANPKDPKVNEHGDKIMGKLRVRDSKTVKILPTKDTGSNEIMVDPFPEDEGKPVTGNQPPPDARENTQPKRPGRK